MKDKVIVEVSTNSFTSFVTNEIRLCISCLMISDKKNVFKVSLDFSKCRKSIPTISNGADHVIGRCGALSCMCDFFLSYT